MKTRQKVVKIDLLHKNKNKKQISRIKLSLLVCLMGIFLLPQVAYFSSITPEKIIELTNTERSKAGLSKLTANQLLTKAALSKGQDILKTQNFQHNINGKRFSAWIRDVGYNYSYAGENLAVDFLTSEGAVETWMNSPTHKANILSSDFTEIGVASVEGKFNGQTSIIIVEIFGNPPMTVTRASIPEVGSMKFDPTNLNQTEGLLTHSITGTKNINLIPSIKEKISLNNEAIISTPSFHIGNLYLENLIAPFRFMPVALGIIASIVLIYLYVINLMTMIRLTKSNNTAHTI